MNEAESERRINELEAQVLELQGFMAEIRNQPGFPTDGRKFTLKFPMQILSPLGVKYSIVRVAGGHLSTIAAPAATSDWSNA